MASETVILLESQTILGKELKKEFVIINDGSVIVNNEKLSATEVITQSENIKNIATFSDLKSLENCTSGAFKHILKKGKILKIEKGCLESARYKVLKENFKALKKDHITQ
jgi:hypothetical protein